MPTPSQNGSNTHAVEEMVLRLFQGQGYAVGGRPEGGETGDVSLAVLQQGNRRALVQFLWGHQEWGEDLIRSFRGRMEDLKAGHGYLVTNGLFTPQAQHVAREMDVSLTDGSALRDILFRTAPPLHRAGSPEEPALPFAKYIPWFVGVSLVVLAVLVLALVAAALSMETAPAL